MKKAILESLIESAIDGNVMAQIKIENYAKKNKCLEQSNERTPLSIINGIFKFCDGAILE